MKYTHFSHAVSMKLVLEMREGSGDLGKDSSSERLVLFSMGSS